MCPVTLGGEGPQLRDLVVMKGREVRDSGIQGWEGKRGSRERRG